MTKRGERTGKSRLQRFVYRVLHYPTYGLFRLVYRYEGHHAERVPAEGGLLLVANHQSYLDPPAIGAALWHRQLDYLARSGLLRIPGFAWFIRMLGAVPIDESGGGAAGVRGVIERLESGEAVLVFPEGARTRDGAMGGFKKGLVLIIQRSGCPVVPVAIEGAFDAWPRTRRLPSVFGKRVAVMYGEPIGHEELLKDGAGSALERLADSIDGMRLELRERLRERTKGRYPAKGAGDKGGRAGGADAEGGEG
jgi:1-acyl-sn-glycerol-3-phosphate acyltransferase